MNNTRKIWPAFLAFAALLLATLILQAQAQAQNQTPDDAIGYVKTVTGEAWVITAGQRVKAQAGSVVLLGSQLKTGAAATMGVTFRDDTVMSFGPDTELTVDEYLYAPARDQFRLSARLARGTLNYLSGVIARLKPDAVSVKTPAGIIGVRGTQFVARVEDSK
jgi:hypothetical protein